MPRTSSSNPTSDNDRKGATSTRSSSRQHKRPLEKSEPPSGPAPVKRAKVEPSIEESPIESDSAPKPRLKASDLEFDYDRTQLRDQRLTPGRESRPRLDSSKVDLNELKTRFSMPWLDKPKKKGPNAYELEVREDVTDPFHHLHVCHKKGPNGGPTYDNAGYQLDWQKVNKWMKPQGYSKSRAVGGMMKALKEAEELEKLLYSVFFIKGKSPDGSSIPWHQVKLKKNILAWEKKGFPQQDATTWWHEPNAEEQKRMLKMMEGASLRKDL